MCVCGNIYCMSCLEQLDRNGINKCPACSKRMRKDWYGRNLSLEKRIKAELESGKKEKI